MLFRTYLLFEKDGGPHLKFESPSSKDALCQILFSGSGEEDETVKSLQTDRRMDGQTDNR